MEYNATEFLLSHLSWGTFEKFLEISTTIPVNFYDSSISYFLCVRFAVLGMSNCLEMF